MKNLLIFLFIIVSRVGYSIPDNKEDTVTVFKVYQYIKCSGILHPEIVIKQAIWETGWFKSKHVLEKNNIFGFRYSKKYMSFESWKSCVDYYKNWQLRKYTNLEEDYYAFLIRIKYATSTKYINSLKSIQVKLPEVICDEK
jgi:uncharacterized FlgJ-related protein